MGWDNTQSRGPIQPHLAQWGQAPRCPNSATTVTLKISATSLLLSSWQKVSQLEGCGEDAGEEARIVPVNELWLGELLCWAGTLPSGLLPQPCPCPTTPSPKPHSLPHSGLPQTSPQWLSGIHAILLIVPGAATKYLTGPLTPTQASQSRPPPAH